MAGIIFNPIAETQLFNQFQIIIRAQFKPLRFQQAPMLLKPAIFGLLYESVFRKGRHGTVIFRAHGQNHVLLQMAGPPGKDGTLPVFPVANQ